MSTNRDSTLRKLVHDAYTIGWVCALPKEQTAAIAMLDERHESLPKPRTDNNTYTLGSIGNHNIVIACLPNMGNSPAATVAASMINNFKSIRFGLMVGIGGGIPPKVRLGDVVVSQPVAEYPGVVQWDMGKMTSDGFERTGALNRPPNSLLTALNRLKSDHEMNGSRIHEYLAEMAREYPRLALKYTRCDSLNDESVDTSTRKSENPILTVWYAIAAFFWHFLALWAVFPTTQSNATDKRGKKRKEVQIHHGLIASGNMVIKDANFRDSLDKRFGGNLLCVEMEAAGLVNDFPCIVIRGICDYADTKKNKEWQEYAASVAAAFAKELLGYVQASDVDTESPVKAILDEIRDAVSKTGKDVQDVKSNQLKEQDNKILDWLTPIEYGAQQNDYLRRRQPGTGEWLLMSTKYQGWLRSSGEKTLFCPGIPGTGKTILTAIVVENLLNEFASSKTIAVAYIYMNFRERQQQTVESVLLSIAKQLIRQSHIPRQIREMYESPKSYGTKPSPINVIRLACEMYSRVFIIIDALDECDTSVRRELLSNIFDLQARQDIKLFATSRFINDILDQFKNDTQLEIRASDDDVERYLDGNIHSLPSCVSRKKSLQDSIKRSITKAVDGMFLLAQLYLNSLHDKLTERAILNALQQFQTLKSGSDEHHKNRVLSGAYDEAIIRIESQAAGFRDLARNVLLWITHAERPLTTLELQHALSVEIDTSELDEKNIPELDDMVSVCAGLVTVDTESQIIRLVHYTAQQYFESRKEGWLSNADVVITQTCVTYLSFEALESLCYKDDLVSSFPFVKYALKYTFDHMSHVANEPKVSLPSDGFFVRFARLSDRVNTDRLKYGQGVGICYVLSTTGHRGLLELALSQRELDINTCGGILESPLQAAIAHGNINVVRLLLNNGANAKALGGSMGSPLHTACMAKDLSVVQKILEQGADINAEIGLMGSPLNAAAVGGERAIVELLLEHGANVNCRAGICGTALQCASHHKDPNTVELLLEKGAEVNANGGIFGNALQAAVYGGRKEIVELLLSKGADIKAHHPLVFDCTSLDMGNSNNTGETMGALQAASFYGRMDVVRFLIQKGFAKDSLYGIFGTALQAAATSGEKDMVKLLLKEGVDINFQGGVFGTALQAAIDEDKKDVDVLLCKGADINASRNLYIDPLQRAIMNGKGGEYLGHVISKGLGYTDTSDHNIYCNALQAACASPSASKAMVQILLDHGADIHQRGGVFDTPLQAAACKERHSRALDTAKVLVARGADVNARGGLLGTALQAASGQGNWKLVQYLIQNNADVGLSGGVFGNVLQAAVVSGSLETMSILVENGADVNALGGIYESVLLAASTGGIIDVVELLLAHGADIRKQGGVYRNAFIAAAANGHIDILQLLLDLGPIDTSSDDNRLLLASLRGDVEDIKKVLGKE